MDTKAPMREETDTGVWNSLADSCRRRNDYYYEQSIAYEERERKRLRNKIKRILRSGRKILSPLLQRL